MYSVKKQDNYLLYYNKVCRKSEELAEKLLKGRYEVREILQEKSDRVVKLIEVEGVRYVLKKERGRGILDIFFKSRGRITLHNSILLKRKGFENAYDVRVAVEKRSRFGVSESYFLADYIEGKEVTSEDYSEVMELLARLHSLGHYHGDAKPKNFIKTDKGIVLIDSRMKKKITRIGICKDVVRFQRRTAEYLDLNKYFKGYKKRLGYYLAVALVYKKELINGADIIKEVL